MDDRAKALKDAINAIARIKDPAERARVCTDALQVIHHGNGVLAEARREAVKALRAANISYRTIAKAIGVSSGRVKPIETGEATGIGIKGRNKKVRNDVHAESHDDHEVTDGEA